MSALEKLGIEDLRKETEELAERLYWFHRLSPGEFYIETILNDIMKRKYVVLWARKVAEPNLREGSVWYLPFNDNISELKEEWSKGYVTLHCGHLDRPKTQYFLIITTNVVTALAERKPVAIWWMCSRCYRKTLKELKNSRVDVLVWDWERHFKLKSRVVPVIIYSSRWWRKKVQYRLVVVDLVLADLLERAKEVLKEWIWWKVYSQGITKTMDPEKRAILIFEIWMPEIENLVGQLRG